MIKKFIETLKNIMAKKRKKVLFEDLPKDERKAILSMVRLYVKQTDMARETGLGIEKSEEIVISMLEDGLLRIVTDGKESFNIVPVEDLFDKEDKDA